MFMIETFTAQPDYAEDRIRMDAISPERQTQSIHLTRRLADRFVPLLVTEIERQVRPGLAREISLAMGQQQLRMEREENPLGVVEPQHDLPPWLCRTVHLGEEQGELVWTLTDDAANTAVMAIPGDGARSVLEVLLVIYRHMEWGLDPFPQWLLEGSDAAESAPRVLN